MPRSLTLMPLTTQGRLYFTSWYFNTLGKSNKLKLLVFIPAYWLASKPISVYLPLRGPIISWASACVYKVSVSHQLTVQYWFFSWLGRSLLGFRSSQPDHRNTLDNKTDGSILKIYFSLWYDCFQDKFFVCECVVKWISALIVEKALCDKIYCILVGPFLLLFDETWLKQ